jgi:probable phosphoglycerate mutase
MSGRRLVLWRHGRTSWNASQRFQGQSDIPLDEVGVVQAAAAARVLARLEPARLLSSDLQRAMATAAPLAAATGLAIEAEPRLRETWAGEWEGLTRAEIDDRYPGELSAWAAGSDLRPGGGETRREVAVRMVEAIGEVVAAMPADATVVLATHGGSARAAIGSLIGLPDEHWAALGVLANGNWSVLAENRSGYGPAWRLQEYNAVSLPVEALADDR